MITINVSAELKCFDHRLTCIENRLEAIEASLARIEAQQAEDHLLLVSIRNQFPGQAVDIGLKAGPVSEQP